MKTKNVFKVFAAVRRHGSQKNPTSLENISVLALFN